MGKGTTGLYFRAAMPNAKSKYVSIQDVYFRITIVISDLVSSLSTEDCHERQRPWSEIRTSGLAVDIAYLTLGYLSSG